MGRRRLLRYLLTVCPSRQRVGLHHLVAVWLQMGTLEEWRGSVASCLERFLSQM
jgi:hypothetical protein